MKISKNTRGGFAVDSQNDLTLAKRDIAIELNEDVDHFDIMNFNYQINCHKRKIEVLLIVIKWLWK